ncbi:kinesin-like nuclear fusion protein [Mucor velutinosus]|uniref:Kinesin-like nuclear fusion protein n=1 Tax=Mucor velutinosus TaxID=708070 RepID=A0AAN7DI95_9FUNG|nr:kinesin-like nuclear fusion protein [Mucor velutinosus]
MADGVNLKTFSLPRKYLPGTDLMSKLLLADQDVINIVVSAVIGKRSTEWIDFTRSDVAYESINCSNDLPRILIEIQNKADMNFYQQLIDYSRSVSRQHKASKLPIVVAIVINSTTRYLLETEIPGSRIPFAKQLSSIGWASSCLFFNAETIAPYLNETPLNPLLVLVHCLIEQETSLINFTQCNDPTLICLYTKMKNILGSHIHDNENSIHALKSVCAQSKSECYKAKAAFENQDQPVGVRIETAVNILSNVIAYVDGIAQKRRLENPLSDFEFAEQQVDKNGHIPWKAQFQQWKILGRFEQYKSYKSAQSAYHRAMKKQKQKQKQTEQQQRTPVVASSSPSPSGARQSSF